MLICGEPSGDQLGGQLMRGLKTLAPGIGITGVGGPAMAAEGLESLFSLDATAVMGLREVLPAIPRILKRVRQATDCALATRPDAVVLIDSPDFTHRIAHAIKKRDPSLRTVNYVAPQVWASRSYRTTQMAKDFDLVLALFPFEVPFLQRYGLRAEFVGHPVIERAAKMVGGETLRARLGLSPATPLLALLPGSRSSEIRFILPVFRQAVEILARRIPGLLTVLPTVPHIAARVKAATKNWPTSLHVLESEADKFAAFDAADVALAASGTVTAELALSRTPMVVGYRVGWLTYALSSLIMNVKYITLVNVLLEREAVPEFLQSHMTPQNLADGVERLLCDPAPRAAQLADQALFAQILGEGTEAPSLRAAKSLLYFINN